LSSLFIENRILFYFLKERIKLAAEKSIAQTAGRAQPVGNIRVNSLCRLLSPGDPNKKRNILKPVNDKFDASPVGDDGNKNDGDFVPPDMEDDLDENCDAQQGAKVSDKEDQMTGHYSVIVKVINKMKATAEVEYVSIGWNDEAIGTTHIVETKRLKEIVKSITNVSALSRFMREFVVSGSTHGDQFDHKFREDFIAA
jgi:hypothetical protein